MQIFTNENKKNQLIMGITYALWTLSSAYILFVTDFEANNEKYTTFDIRFNECYQDDPLTAILAFTPLYPITVVFMPICWIIALQSKIAYILICNWFLYMFSCYLVDGMEKFAKFSKVVVDKYIRKIKNT
jgi:hypothetical protein